MKNKDRKSLSDHHFSPVFLRFSEFFKMQNEVLIPLAAPASPSKRKKSFSLVNASRSTARNSNLTPPGRPLSTSPNSPSSPEATTKSTKTKSRLLRSYFFNPLPQPTGARNLKTVAIRKSQPSTTKLPPSITCREPLPGKMPVPV